MVNAEELKSNLKTVVKDKQVEKGKITLTKGEIADAVEKSKKKDANEIGRKPRQ